MSIMTQLEFELDFSNSEKQLAKYILDNGEEILTLSIKELAKKTYTSPATIVRLCQKIGLEGFLDFKIKYSAELQYDNTSQKRIDVNYPFKSNDTPVQIAHKIASMHKETIDDTIKLIDFKTLDKSVSTILKANHIYIYGNGNSLLAGMSFQHKMLRIQKPVTLCTLPGEHNFLSYMANIDDVAIIISYSGETKELVDNAKLLYEKKIPIIAITSIGDNQLSRYATYVLNTGSREKIFSKIAPFASKTSIEYILDLLFSCIFTLDYNNHLYHKLKYDKAYDFRHPQKSPINE